MKTPKPKKPKLSLAPLSVDEALAGLLQVNPADIAKLEAKKQTKTATQEDASTRKRKK